MIVEDPADDPRPMIESDVPEIVEVQERGAVAALAAIFPQDQYPFPRETVGIRWIEEINDPKIDCYLIQDHDRVAGFVARKDSQLLNLCTGLATWDRPRVMCTWSDRLDHGDRVTVVWHFDKLSARTDCGLALRQAQCTKGPRSGTSTGSGR